MISKLNQFTRSNKTHRLNTRVVLTVLIRATIMANTRALSSISRVDQIVLSYKYRT